MGGVLVDDDELAALLHKDVELQRLADKAQRLVLRRFRLLRAAVPV